MQKRKRERRTVRKIIRIGEKTESKETVKSGSKLTKSLEENIKILEDKFKNDGTVIFRRFQNRYLPKAKCCILKE